MTAYPRAGAIQCNAAGTAVAYTQTLRDGGQVVYEKAWALPSYTVSSEKTYITAGGRMAVTRQTVLGTTTFTYYATDHLGTVRSTVTANASGVEQARTFHDYEPSGRMAASSRTREAVNCVTYAEVINTPHYWTNPCLRRSPMTTCATSATRVCAVAGLKVSLVAPQISRSSLSE